MKNISLFFVFVVFMEGVFGESVTEGGSVTLKTGLSEINPDEVIEWRFVETLIGRVRKGIDPSLYGDVLDGKFKGRLRLDSKTGDLTISSTKTSDSGEYKVSNSITDLKTFTVTVNAAAPESGLSPGGIAGIVIAVIAAVAAAVGGIYYGYKKKGGTL
ncbi:uncharacterized protein LOC120486644 isoform X2 [Pimephales promelas]|uniref:uncharacterized protein LOC120486644 isoform X2 n=1 Tax=Pimephales promelas TaxID=90988 RepID=UPI0019554A6B|nr:uncharacterized protein LOC120486644 isoform X2 [Pimephales promelas]